MHHPTVGAGLPAMAPVQVPQNFPTILSGCPSERVPLTFVSRCQFSDRDCKPAETSPVSHKRLYNCGAFSWSLFMAAVCGRPSGLPRLAGDLRACRPAHNCPPSSASDAGSSYFTPEVCHKVDAIGGKRPPTLGGIPTLELGPLWDKNPPAKLAQRVFCLCSQPLKSAPTAAPHAGV